MIHFAAAAAARGTISHNPAPSAVWQRPQTCSPKPDYVPRLTPPPDFPYAFDYSLSLSKGPSINGEFLSVILNTVKDLREAISTESPRWLH